MLFSTTCVTKLHDPGLIHGQDENRQCRGWQGYRPPPKRGQSCFRDFNFRLSQICNKFPFKCKACGKQHDVLVAIETHTSHISQSHGSNSLINTLICTPDYLWYVVNKDMYLSIRLQKKYIMSVWHYFDPMICLFARYLMHMLLTRMITLQEDRHELDAKEATCHYLNQCWPKSMALYGVTRSQWNNVGMSYLHTDIRTGGPQKTGSGRKKQPLSSTLWLRLWIHANPNSVEFKIKGL